MKTDELVVDMLNNSIDALIDMYQGVIEELLENVEVSATIMQSNGEGAVLCLCCRELICVNIPLSQRLGIDKQWNEHPHAIDCAVARAERLIIGDVK